MSTKQLPVVTGRMPIRDRVWNAAELISDLGDIPPDRILLDPPPGQATEADLVRLVDGDQKILCELVDDVLVEKPVGWKEGALALELGRYLLNYLDENNLGQVGGADSMLRLARGLVRLPDLAFVLWEHLPDDEEDLPSILDLAPDLAVEVISPSNTPKEMTRKRREYFKAGTTLVWQVYPKTRTVEVYTSPTRFHTLGIDDTLDGGTLLPGFRLPLRTLFARRAKGARRRKK
ncbi:MAG: Uma2 family endonuclease [Zavarzinella sp.]|nr:Uma2 family endonuclease [Zavarzinella sp.]